MNDPEPTKAHKPASLTGQDETLDDVHPLDDQLLQFVAGRLAEPKAAQIESHLESCCACPARIDELCLSIDSFVAGLRNKSQATGTVTENETVEETTDQSDPATFDSSMTRSIHGDEQEGSAVASFGDYEIINEIARGGMGVVYKARQRSLNRVVALKMIKSGEFANQEQVDRFYKEAEAAANLDHPGIVPVHEVGEINGQHYFTMGFVDGDSLADRLRNGPLPPKEAARYAKSIAEAVAFAHSKGVIHRDLKPGNVLITKEGTLRITDFGLAKRIEEDSELTSTGQVLGTPSYMPPEQAEGKLNEIGPAADVYAVGATLYCMLVGRPPFQAANVIETLNELLHSDPVSLKSLNSTIPLDLETLCLKCLEKKPSNRYESADVLVTELRYFLNGEPIQARPIGRVERSTRWCKRKPIHATALALMFVLSVGGPALAFGLIWSNRQTAVARVDILLNATPATIPLILGELDRDASAVSSRLNQLKSDDLTPQERLRLSLALLPSDSSQLSYLKDRLSDCGYEELAVVLERMKQHGGASITPNLLTTFHDETTKNNAKFRAGIALASLHPDSDQWTGEDYQFLAISMLEENTLHQPAIRQSLQPLADKLLGPVEQAFSDDTANDTVRESAANAIVGFAGHDANLLTELSMVATPKQHSILFPPVDQHAESDETIAKTLIDVTKLQPTEDDNEAQRVAMGKRRAGAAINLVRMGHLDESLEVLCIKEDPESLTQFVYGCKDRGVTVTQLLDLLNRATSITERYGILLALGEFKLTEIPEDIRTDWVELVKSLYANDPSSGIHGASGWLLRHWGLTEKAKTIEEDEVPYNKDHEWFTLKINLAGPPDIESYSYFTFVVFPPGEYQIGSPDYELDRRQSDEERCTVKITRSFAVLNREVNRSEFDAVTGFRGYINDKEWAATSAMSSASWYQSVQFCRQLTLLRGMDEQEQAYENPTDYKGVKDDYRSSSGISNPPKNWKLDLSKEGFRLPTSAEWEIACRGGALSRYGFGCDVAHLGHYGWYAGNSSDRGHLIRDLRPNHRGLFDMHGNMTEWCHDWWGVNSAEGLSDPLGPPAGSLRELRGSGWRDNADYCRSALRFHSHPAGTNDNIGFRVVLSIGVSSSHPQ